MHFATLQGLPTRCSLLRTLFLDKHLKPSGVTIKLTVQTTPAPSCTFPRLVHLVKTRSPYTSSFSDRQDMLCRCLKWTSDLLLDNFTDTFFHLSYHYLLLGFSKPNWFPDSVVSTNMDLIPAARVIILKTSFHFNQSCACTYLNILKHFQEACFES